MSSLNLEPYRLVVQTTPAVWDKMTASIGKLGPDFLLEHIPMLDVKFLPGQVNAPAYRRLQHAIENNEAAGPKPTAAGSSSSLPDEKQKKRRVTKQKLQFQVDCKKNSDQEALAAIAQKTSRETVATYDSASQPYVDFCREKGWGDGFPVVVDRLRVFAGHMKLSDAYKTNSKHLCVQAVVSLHNSRFAKNKLPADEVSDILDGLPDEDGEQSEPLGVDELAQLVASATTDETFDAALSLTGAVLCLARIDSFLAMDTTDAVPAAETVKISVGKLKGRNKKKVKPIEFEALTEPVIFPNKKFGQVNFCPVFVFGLLRARAKGSKLSNFSSYSKCRETMNWGHVYPPRRWLECKHRPHYC